MNIFKKTYFTIATIFISLTLAGCSSIDKSQSVAPEAVFKVNTKKVVQPISSRVEMVKYNRKLYRHWIDEDRDCQNTRAEILIKTSLSKPKFKTSKNCLVVSGKWYDSYSGEYIYIASKVDIDHIAPLKYAHDHGAYTWSKKKREQFANDVENLIPVSARLNRQKGAKGPLEWMPPNQGYHCDYIKRWEVVQRKYNLVQPVRSPSSLSFERMKVKACKK